MILAAIRDSFLLHSVRRAALPAEDVLCGGRRCPGCSRVGLPEGVSHRAGCGRGGRASHQGQGLRSSRAGVGALGLARAPALGVGDSDSAHRHGPGQDAPVDQRSGAPLGLGGGASPRFEPCSGTSSSARARRAGAQDFGVPVQVRPPRRSSRSGGAHAWGAQGPIPTPGFAVAIRVHHPAAGALCQQASHPARHDDCQGGAPLGVLEQREFLPRVPRPHGASRCRRHRRWRGICTS